MGSTAVEPDTTFDVVIGCASVSVPVCSETTVCSLSLSLVLVVFTTALPLALLMLTEAEPDTRFDVVMGCVSISVTVGSETMVGSLKLSLELAVFTMVLPLALLMLTAVEPETTCVVVLGCITDSELTL